MIYIIVFDDVICKPPIDIKFEKHFDYLKLSCLMTQGELEKKFLKNRKDLNKVQEKKISIWLVCKVSKRGIIC